MSWVPLYIDLQYGDILGDSLSTYNYNFATIDTYLENLSGLQVDGLLLAVNNLSDVLSAEEATANLGFGSIAPLDDRSCSRASVTFNGKVWTTVLGENLCQIYSAFNVDKVVRISEKVFDIYYTDPIVDVGAIVGTCSEGYFLVNYERNWASNTFSNTICSVTTLDAASSNVNVVVYGD